MKYTVSNTIHALLNDVASKFLDPNGVMNWMEGIDRFEHISGTPGEVGAISDIYSTHKGKQMKITETVLENNMPNQIKFGYQSPMGYNEVEMQFKKIDDSSVKQINNSYFELKGFMKIMGFLFKGIFKKQSMKYLDGFKKYVEG
ncbi:MAG: SRPBCC family protein [Crocinitomicaceae bacterium]